MENPWLPRVIFMDLSCPECTKAGCAEAQGASMSGSHYPPGHKEYRKWEKQFKVSHYLHTRLWMIWKSLKHVLCTMHVKQTIFLQHPVIHPVASCDLDIPCETTDPFQLKKKKSTTSPLNLIWRRKRQSSRKGSHNKQGNVVVKKQPGKEERCNLISNDKKGAC